MEYVNGAGETFAGTVIGVPPTEHTPHWQCYMRVVPGALTTPEIRAPFERLVKSHAKLHGWRVRKVNYTRSNVSFYVEPLRSRSSV